MDTISELQAIPRQSFNVVEGDHTYTIRIYENYYGNMYCDIAIDGTTVSQGFRILIGQLLIPYPALEVDGNFLLDFIDGDETADYEEFNETQFLRYLTQDETDAWREAWKSGSY